MPTSQARVPTDRGRRYLAQLRAHSGRIGLIAAHRQGHGAGAPAPRHTDWSDAGGVIDFGWGRCTLLVTEDALTLRAEAADAQRLRQIEERVGGRLERIGRRDRLAVTWRPLTPPAGAAAAPEAGTEAGTGGGTGRAPEAEAGTRAEAALEATTAPVPIPIPIPVPASTPAPRYGTAAEVAAALMTPEGRADPFPLYAAAHRLGPVSAITGGWFLVCGYAAVDQVLRDPGFGLPDPAGSATEEGELSSLSHSVLRANPPDHGRMRALMSQAFTPRRVAALRPAIETAVDVLLDRLAAAGTRAESEAAAGPGTRVGADTGADTAADTRTATEAGTAGSAEAGPRQAVDFMDRFAFPLPVTVICELLGVPAAHRDRFRPLAADLTLALELSSGAAGTADSAAADAAARELAAHLVPLIADRRAHPRDDLVSTLAAARAADDGRLSDRELLANLVTLLVAGFETTTSLLGNGLAVLLGRPDLAAGVRDGTVPVDSFVEEVLRHDSPVQVATRRARADGLTAAGVPVPRGSDVILLIGAANHDPARYPDPAAFDPARPALRPLSFGAGPHICLGNALARLEAAVAFPRLLARFPALAAAPHSRPTRRDRLVLRGYETLPVILDPR